MEEELRALGLEIEQHRVATSLLIDARGDQIKREIGQAAELLFDNLKTDTAKATVEVDRIRQDCATLQGELMVHQQGQAL